MTLLIHPTPSDTNLLLAQVLTHSADGTRVRFLTSAGVGSKVVQRLRVALTRSRNRNRRQGKKVAAFTLSHSIHKYTDKDGKRYDCVVMWTEKHKHHKTRELLDDLMERTS